MHRGLMKFEFLEPPRNKSEMEQIVKSTVSILEPKLGTYEIQVVKCHPFQLIEEQDCECYIELTLELVSEKFDDRILDAMSLFLSEVGTLKLRQPPNIVLHSQEFWQTELRVMVKDIPLSAIYFGNIHGDSFMNHWEVSFWNQRRSGPINRIFVHFEFDKTDMMMVEFKCQDKVKNGNSQSASYQVTTRRDTIRRIIVDPNVSDSHGSNRVRIHFELNCPPLIRRGTMDKEKQSNSYGQPFYHRRRAFQCEWDDHGYPTDQAISDSPFFTIEFDTEVSNIEIYLILCRLRARTGTSIEFQCLTSIDVPMGRKSPYHRWTIINKVQKAATDSDAAIYREFLSKLFYPPNWQIVDGKEIDLNDERKFAITYLIECLISRGAVVKDQLLLSENHWGRFLEIIIFYYEKDDKLCEAALEDLVHLVDGRKRIGPIFKCLDRICQKRQKMNMMNGLAENEIKEGYQRVRKLVFTPTRVIYVAPETIMGNRVLRKYDKDGTKVLRITFRDDNNKKMRLNVTEDLLEATAKKYLTEGIRVANRDYGFLGCSNSQMRDNGAYFMQKYSDTQRERFLNKNYNDMVKLKTYTPIINAVTNNLGRFEKVENIPKLMARLGQCFTQSRLTGVKLTRSDYCRTFDYTGGKNNGGDEYTFSDGVGQMSYEFARQISVSMNFGRSVPSCFQIRFRGMKGVVAIDPTLDELRKWSTINDVVSLGDRKSWDIKCAFRPSQIKFESKAVPGEQLEMVKYASPVLVALNKPFINILDQVSEMQSLECHRRVTGRIEELMDRQILSFAKQMNEETYCRNKLKEFPRRVDVDYLKTMWGFTLSSEPFFRSLIKASIKFSITKQLQKEQIQIPKGLGRSMLGVVDETGRLQYGQIFVQYTKNSQKKKPLRTSNMEIEGSEIVTGTVLLTKNPCIVPGDVRIFEAVDIPELRHHCDVVVFPQHGPRPHPDEMAGSDLDGDEYSVIWDQQLLLVRNEEPFDFSVEKKKIPYDKEKIKELMSDFYVKYLELDSVGQISNSHLHNSDQYGLTAEVCMNLAKKNSQAVDFTKSGEPPEPLTREWRKNEETGEMIPPEAPERVPDFHIGNERNPMYVSPRLCGRLFREFQAIDNVIKISEELDGLFDIKIDENIMINGFENYLHSARKDLANYNGQLRSIMETYGITSEGEIISGCIVEMRNRISDKDQDDMSFYNTNLMIETRITSLICKFRERFFEEFGGFRSVCTQTSNTHEEGNCLSYRCDGATLRIMQKAVAWYRACYEFAQSSSESRKLSFAWIVYDVIGKVKELNMLNNGDAEMGGSNPMYTYLEQHRKQYLTDHRKEFEEFLETNKFIGNDAAEAAIAIVKQYLTKIPGLKEVIFMIYQWAKQSELFNLGPMRAHHVFLLFILFATRQISSVDGNAEPYFSKIEKDDVEIIPPLTEEKRSIMMVKFLEYMASRKFRKLPHISFSSIGFSSIFMRGEWQIYHVAAIKTYYNVLFNLRFEELPVSTDPTITATTVIRENEPFVIELPDGIDPELVKEMIKLHSGTADAKIRRMQKAVVKDKAETPPATVRYIVSSIGTLESFQRLKKLVAVTIPIKSHLGGKDVSRQMAFLCHNRIMNGSI